MNFTAIDFETAAHSRDSACSIGLVRVKDGIIVEKVMHLIKPPSSEFFFTHVHGLTWLDVMNAKTFGELWPEIEYLFKDIDFVAAHSAPFDKSVLAACMKTYSISPPTLTFECSMRAAKKKWNLTSAKLPDVCRFLKIELNHHEALADALACAQIILAIKNQ